jgi:replication initiation and membrane attachment protein DnaB
MLGTEKVIFRTTVRFLSVATGIMDRCRVTNRLFASGFKNRCRLTDMNLNNLRTINQNIYILNSILLFKTKIFDQRNARV